MTIEVGITTTVRTGGLDRLIARFAALEALVAEYAQRVYDLAYPHIPRESGDDAATLRIVHEGLSAIVSLGAGLPGGYGVLQELGFHHFSTGQYIQNPALIPAFEQVVPEFIAAVRALFAGG